ncbi:oligosaccharide flippase family protein [Acetatifactor muris]|uniref:oligosaccharide flippase family protein n=1 Tax=Acetatifactor muris TaxID=879566 RepID=UPI0023F31F0D|nr:oligosaccharide flippase family protein [Acetatifactor muris]
MNHAGRNRSIFKTVFSVSSVLLIAKLLGFVKQIVVANAFGATADTDVISLSQGIITDFEFLIAQTMITAFIPIYISVKENNQDEKHFVSNVLKIFGIISILISSLIFAFSPMVSKIIAPSYSGEIFDSLVHNVRIYAFSLVILVITAIFNALLKGNDSFLPGEITSVNQSLVFIVCIILFSSSLGVQTLILSFLLYAAVNLFYLGMYSKKYWRFELRGFTFDDNVKRLLKMIAPLLFSYAMVYINQLVDKILATELGGGTVTAMSYSAVLTNFITGFTGAVCGIAFTRIAQNIARKDDEKTALIIRYFITFFVTILIPVTIISIVNAKDIVTAVYGRGAFDSAAIESSTYALMGYGGMFIPCALRELFTRLQYGYQDSRGPTINSTISIVVNIILSIVLSRFWGILGITVASTISVLISAVMNIVSSRKHNRYLKISDFKQDMIFWLIGIGACICVKVLICKYINIQNTYARFCITAMITLSIYGVVVLPVILRVLKGRNLYRNS